MSNEKIREQFEKTFPVPEGVRWNPDFAGIGRYEPENSLLDPNSGEAAWRHHQRWIGWNEAMKLARAQENQGESYQSRVDSWMQASFGPEISANKQERNHRYLEESLELVRSLGCTQEAAHQLVKYEFDRPAGDPPQEVGGAKVTLAALCSANGIDMEECAENELARVWTKIESIREKQKSKPETGPLPGIYPDRQPLS